MFHCHYIILQVLLPVLLHSFIIFEKNVFSTFFIPISHVACSLHLWFNILPRALFINEKTFNFQTIQRLNKPAKFEQNALMVTTGNLSLF